MFYTNDSKILIKHCLTGRVRLSVPWLKKNKTGLSQVLDYLISIPGVKKAEGSSATGSILVCFEEGLLNPAEVMNLVGEALAGEPGKVCPPFEEKNVNQTQGIKEPEDLPVQRQTLNVALGGGVLGFFALKHALVGKSPLACSEKLFNIAAATAIISGYPIFKSGVKNLLTRGRINYDLVMGALSLGTLLMRESVPGLLVVWLVNLNSPIQSLVLAQSQKAVEDFIAAAGTDGKEYRENTSGGDIRQKPPYLKTPAAEHAERIIPVSLGLVAVSAVTTRDFNTALATLLAGSPSPAGLARPGALSAATALALKKGILARRPAAFARLREVDSIVFTGGGFPGCRPEIVEALPLPGFSRPDLISLARDALQYIQTENVVNCPKSEIFDSSTGGILVSVDGQSILIGGKEFMSLSGVNTHPAFLKEKRLRLNRMFPLYLARNGVLASLFSKFSQFKSFHY